MLLPSPSASSSQIFNIQITNRKLVIVYKYLPPIWLFISMFLFLFIYIGCLRSNSTLLKSKLFCMRHPFESNSTYHLHEDNDCILEAQSSLFIPVLKSSSSLYLTTMDQNKHHRIVLQSGKGSDGRSSYDSKIADKVKEHQDRLNEKISNSMSNEELNINYDGQPYLVELGPVHVSFELTDVRIQSIQGSWMWILRWFPRKMSDLSLLDVEAVNVANQNKATTSNSGTSATSANSESQGGGANAKLIKSKGSERNIHNVYVRARSSLIQFDDNGNSQQIQHEILFEADYLLFSFRSYEEAKGCVDSLSKFLDKTKKEKGAVTLLLSFDNSISPYIQHGLFLFLFLLIGMVLSLPYEEIVTFAATQDMFTHVIKNCIRVVLSRYSLPIDRVSGMRINTVSVANIEAGGRMNISLKSHKEYTLFIVVHDGDGIREIPLCFGKAFTNREQVMNAMKSLNNWLQSQLQTSEDMISETNDNVLNNASQGIGRQSGKLESSISSSFLASPTTITSRSSLRNGSPNVSICVVCLSRQVKVALLPCKHACLCNICAEQLINPQKCPICRQLIKDKISLYF